MQLFQYGSNMSFEGLQKKIYRHARKYVPKRAAPEIGGRGIARLRGWRVVFDLYSRDQDSLVADIVPDSAGEVWGVRV